MQSAANSSGKTPDVICTGSIELVFEDTGLHKIRKSFNGRFTISVSICPTIANVAGNQGAESGEQSMTVTLIEGAETLGLWHLEQPSFADAMVELEAMTIALKELIADKLMAPPTSLISPWSGIMSWGGI